MPGSVYTNVLPLHLIYQTLFFDFSRVWFQDYSGRGLGWHKNAKWIRLVIALFPSPVQFQPRFSFLSYHTVMRMDGAWEAGRSQGTRLLTSFSSLAYHTAMRSWAEPGDKTTETQLQVTYLCVLLCEVQGVWSSLEE